MKASGDRKNTQVSKGIWYVKIATGGAKKHQNRWSGQAESELERIMDSESGEWGQGTHHRKVFF